jgi:hypothetical protein
VLGIAGQHVAAGVDDVEVDDVGQADRLLPDRVVEAQQVELAEVEPVAKLEGGALPQDQPGTPPVNLFSRPVEKGLQTASCRVRSRRPRAVG